MNVALLAINIGNTRTQVGCFMDGSLVTEQSFDNGQIADWDRELKKIAEPLLEHEDPTVLIASVNPPVAEVVVQKIKLTLGLPALRVEKDINIPIGRQIDADSQIGEDRLVNAAAAYAALKQACIVVDAGTAITVDFVDGAGTFHGGAIAPGARLMLDALRHGTEQLPRVDFQPPVEAIGHNTTEAMRTAVFHGIRGMVRELVEKFAEQVGAYPLVIATGGDAKLLFEDYDLIERIVPSLTLDGIRVTLAAQLKDDA